MPYSSHSAPSTAPLAFSCRQVLSEILLCLSALLLTIIDLGRRLVTFSLLIIFKVAVKLVVTALLAAVFLLAYCLFMALHPALGPAANSQMP